MSNSSEDILEWTSNWSASALETLCLYSSMFWLLNGNIGDSLCVCCLRLSLCGYICVLESYLYFVFKKSLKFQLPSIVHGGIAPCFSKWLEVLASMSWNPVKQRHNLRHMEQKQSFWFIEYSYHWEPPSLCSFCCYGIQLGNTSKKKSRRKHYCWSISTNVTFLKRAFVVLMLTIISNSSFSPLAFVFRFDFYKQSWRQNSSVSKSSLLVKLAKFRPSGSTFSVPNN